MRQLDNASLHAHLVMIAERLNQCSHEFSRVGDRLVALCAAVERLVDEVQSFERRDGSASR